MLTCHRLTLLHLDAGPPLFVQFPFLHCAVSLLSPCLFFHPSLVISFHHHLLPCPPNLICFLPLSFNLSRSAVFQLRFSVTVNERWGSACWCRCQWNLIGSPQLCKQKSQRNTWNIPSPPRWRPAQSLHLLTPLLPKNFYSCSSLVTLMYCTYK